VIVADRPASQPPATELPKGKAKGRTREELAALFDLADKSAVDTVAAFFPPASGISEFKGVAEFGLKKTIGSALVSIFKRR
jgi:hypothetical protein